MESVFPFRPRLRMVGHIDFCCPHCGHIASIRIAKLQWRFQCPGEHCRRKFAFGFQLFSLERWEAKGKTPPVPEDMIFPIAVSAILPEDPPYTVHSANP